MNHRISSKLPLIGSAALCAALGTFGCAQILGTNDYKVSSELFEDAGSKPNKPGPRDKDDEDTKDAEVPKPGADDSSETHTGPKEAGPSEPTSTTEPVTDPSSDPSTDPSTDPPTDPTTEPTTDPTSDTEPPDNGCGVPGVECTLVPQCGCDDGQNCTVVDPTSGETQCVAVGTLPPNTPCNQTDAECAVGYACVAGVCKELCDDPESEGCGVGAYDRCDQVTVGGAPAPGYFVCQHACNPVAPSLQDEVFTACGTGANCIPGPNGQSACTGATPSGLEGANCKGVVGIDAESCAPGYACVSLAADATCQKSCDLDGADCAAGQSCVPYSEPVGAADRRIGYCQGCEVPANSECDPVAQCGCSAGESCSIVDFGTGQTACIAPGDVPEGGACTGGAIGECAPGTDCMVWVETGVCSRFCDQDSDCPNPNGGCDVWGDWSAQISKMCLRGCDPRDPTSSAGPFLACPEGQSCTPWYDNENSNCVVPEAYGEEGDECVDEDNCSPTLACGLDGAHSCGRWCELGGSDCLLDELCLPHPRYQEFGTELLAAGVNMGVCMMTRGEFANVDLTPLGDPVTDEDPPAETLSTIEVTDFAGFLSHVAVGLSIEHSYVSDIDVFLTAPDGTRIQLVRGSDLGAPVGEGITEAVFDDISPFAMSEGVEPYTDVFAPIGSLWKFSQSNAAGVDPNGTWTLTVVDNLVGDEGTLLSWSLLMF